jgi:hypothetical protein
VKACSEERSRAGRLTAVLTLTTGSRAAEGPDGEPRTRASRRPRVPEARGLVAIFALVVTALVASPDAAHADTSADLWCTMSPQSPKAIPGTNVSVTVTCGNKGPDTSDNSLLVYTYPAGTTLGPLPSGWGSESSTAAGILVSYASGETRQYTFTVIVPASEKAGSTLAQEIRGLPGTTDPNPGNDVASGQLSVVKATVPPSVAPSRTSASPTHRPTTTRATASPSATTSPSASPLSSATVTPSATAGDQTPQAAPLASDAAGPLAAGSGSGGGAGPSLLALALIAVGALLIVGGAVAALLLRRNRPIRMG